MHFQRLMALVLIEEHSLFWKLLGFSLLKKKLNIFSPFLSLLPLIRRNDVINILNFSDDHFQVKLVPFIHSCHEIPPVLKRENQETC